MLEIAQSSVRTDLINSPDAEAGRWPPHTRANGDGCPLDL